MLGSKNDKREGAQPPKNVSVLGGNEEGTGALNLRNNLRIDDPQVDWKS